MRSVDAGAEQAANPRAHACAPEQVAVSPPDTCAFFLGPHVTRGAGCNVRTRVMKRFIMVVMKTSFITTS